MVGGWTEEGGWRAEGRKAGGLADRMRAEGRAADEGRVDGFQRLVAWLEAEMLSSWRFAINEWLL